MNKSQYSKAKQNNAVHSNLLGYITSGTTYPDNLPQLQYLKLKACISKEIQRINLFVHIL